MRIHGSVVVKPPFALGFAKPKGIPGEEATPNATPSTRSIKPSAFQTSVDARHAGALIAARYATGSAVTPISASSQPVNEKGAGYRVKHEMLDDLPPARTRKSGGPNALCVSPSTDNSSVVAIRCYNSFLNVIAFPASNLFIRLQLAAWRPGRRPGGLSSTTEFVTNRQ